MTDAKGSGITGREIVGAGTSEAVWQAWPPLAKLVGCTLDELLPPGSRLVVVAPHPDDEVLACGGVLAMAAQRTAALLLVSVTDGEASHPGSLLWPPARLAKRRRDESLEGLRRLGCEAPNLRCRVPDGHVEAHRDSLAARLSGMLSPGDTVLTTWAWDGHRDHEATAQVVRAACDAAACRLFELPVWMWHWASPGDLRVPWSRLRRLRLSAEAARRKADAVAAHQSQLVVQDTGAAPVLPAAALQRLLRPDEYVFWPDGDADASPR